MRFVRYRLVTVRYELAGQVGDQGTVVDVVVTEALKIPRPYVAAMSLRFVQISCSTATFAGPLLGAPQV